mgnify:CR=1 FL=1
MNTQPHRRIIVSFLFAFLFYAATLPAQNPQKLDSLHTVLKNTTNAEQQATLYRNIGNEYLQNKQLDSSLVYAHKALQVLQSLNDEKAIARLHLSIANVYGSKGDTASSMAYFKKSVAYYDNNEDEEARAQINYSLAALYAIQKKYAEAETYYLKTVSAFRRGVKVDPQYLMYAYQGLNYTYVAQQQYSNALNINTEYIAFVEKNYPDLLGAAHQQIAGLYRTTSQYDKAIESLKKSTLYFRQKNDPKNIAYNNQAIGTVFFNKKQYDSSNIYLQKALQHYQAVKSDIDISNILNVQSGIAFAQKDYALAEALIVKALALINEKSENYIYHNSFLLTVRLTQFTEDSSQLTAQRKNELEKLTLQLTKNFDAVIKTDYVNPNLIIHNYQVLSKANEMLGNYDKAFDYFKKGTEFKDSVYGTEQLRDFANKEAELEVVKERTRVQLIEETKRLQLQKEIELKALRFEYEKKQAAAKTAEERKRLLLEEELKRRDIEANYQQEQQAITLKFEQEKEIARINQEKKDAVAAAELRRTKNIRNMSIIGGLLALVLLSLAIWSYLRKKKDNKIIAQEKQKSDELLLNILPQEVADELKLNGHTKARMHDAVTILFTDFVNFTSNSEKIGVQALMDELNTCFTAFDKIMEQYGLEKIKTIGDAYLAVSGLPSSNEQHAQNAVKAALAIAAFVEQRRTVNPNALAIRIGINSGNVIAGIVGVKKFAYDIWGDAVNTASRMEQSSEVGKVNISHSTYELINTEFNCTYRGKINTKGKGDMDMYFVHSVNS